MRPELREESKFVPRYSLSHRQPADLERRVMEHLRASNHPLGAHEIARRSRQTGSPLAPNQVYRILERLLQRGEVRRIELLSAYTLAQDDKAGFAVCADCRTVTPFEAEYLAGQIEQLCRARGFESAMPIIEVSGLCPECRAHRASAFPIRRMPGMAMLFALLSLAGGSAPGAIARADAVPVADGGEKTGRSRLFESAPA